MSTSPTHSSPANFRTLSEHDSKGRLAEAGVATCREELVSSAAEAAAAAARIGFPVAVKLCGATIAHKTERGLVRLGCGDAAAAEAAAAELLALATEDDGDVGVLISEMVRGNRELIAGVNVDEQFGPTIMIGFGGILAEAIADVSFRLLPISELDAQEMIDDLQTTAMLDAFRGEPAIDRDALAKLLVGLGNAALEIDDLASIDINPLIVADGKPIAVDALVVMT